MFLGAALPDPMALLAAMVALAVAMSLSIVVVVAVAAAFRGGGGEGFISLALFPLAWLWSLVTWCSFMRSVLSEMLLINFSISMGFLVILLTHESIIRVLDT